MNVCTSLSIKGEKIFRFLSSTILISKIDSATLKKLVKFLYIYGLLRNLENFLKNSENMLVLMIF